ncbi:MAG TPA: hypothetical protein VGF75_05220 [Candidatus Saccharimonadales bacterium]|jgi:hypothetical protein
MTSTIGWEKQRELSDRTKNMVEGYADILAERDVVRVPLIGRDYNDLSVIAFFPYLIQPLVLPSSLYVEGGATLHLQARGIINQSDSREHAVVMANILYRDRMNSFDFMGSVAREAISHTLNFGFPFVVESFSPDALDGLIGDYLVDLELPE